jgi:cell division protein FtsB
MTVVQIIYRTSCIVLAVALLAALGMFLVPVIREANALRAEKMTLEADIARKETRIRELRSNQDRFVNDPDFVEHTAREIGLVTPDETVYEYDAGTTRTNRE